jgi:hypothetical protein
MKRETLREVCEDNRRRFHAIDRVISDFRGYLAGPKFQGECEDNISIHEVYAYLDRIIAARCGDNSFGDLSEE